MHGRISRLPVEYMYWNFSSSVDGVAIDVLQGINVASMLVAMPFVFNPEMALLVLINVVERPHANRPGGGTW